jgi:hypothetical protein
MKDTEQYNQVFNSLIPVLDVPGAKFCADLWLQLQLLDDVYDRDELTKEESLKLVKLTLIDIPNNPFYRSYAIRLNPLMESLYLQWTSANRLEEEKRDLDKAYMLRAFIIQVFHYCSAILHGIDYAESMDFQQFYKEKFNDYKREFENA